MTHAELVARAVRWLRTTRRCGVVLREHRGLTFQVPDAVGWKGWHSVEVECKVSRADFLADQRKGRLRLANEQFYMVVPGIVEPEDVPGGWGLLEVGTRVREVVMAPPAFLDADGFRRNVGLLYTEVRRYQVQGIKYRPVRRDGRGLGDGGSLGSLVALCANEQHGAATEE